MNVCIISCGPGLLEIVKQYGHSSEWIPKAINNPLINYKIAKVYNNDLIDIKSSDAFIITGSKYSVYDECKWISDLISKTKEIINADKPILGICFGHQIIASALGGVVKRNNLGWELGSYNLSLTDEGKNSLLFKNFNDQDIVYESHQDVVAELPNNSKVLAYTEKANQSFIYKDNVFGVQFHPEFSYDVTRKLMDLRLKKGVKVDSNTLNVSKNGMNVLKNFSNFILGG